ncbi:transposase family protein [Roseomonas sp. GCM10028921]
MLDLNPSSLLPPGLVVGAVEVGPDLISITAHPEQTSETCPTCGLRSARTHSLHRRRLLDLPSHGRSVELLVRARRFRYLAADCPRRTFTQSPLPEMAGRRERRPLRLDGLVEALSVALGGPGWPARSGPGTAAHAAHRQGYATPRRPASDNPQHGVLDGD